jgi:hypothetical protein
MFNEILTVWSNQPGISATIWLAILVFVAYLGRNPAHQLIYSTVTTSRGQPAAPQ